MRYTEEGEIVELQEDLERIFKLHDLDVIVKTKHTLYKEKWIISKDRVLSETVNIEKNG